MNVRISRAKFLIVLAILIIVLIELRTLLGMFGIQIQLTTLGLIAILAIGGLFVWVFLPRIRSQEL